MALVKVLSEQTEAEITLTLKQLQVALASAQEFMENADARTASVLTRVDQLLARVERILDAVTTVGKS